MSQKEEEYCIIVCEPFYVKGQDLNFQCSFLPMATELGSNFGAFGVN
jgi:hypothetical protein